MQSPRGHERAQKTHDPPALARNNGRPPPPLPHKTTKLRAHIYVLLSGGNQAGFPSLLYKIPDPAGDCTAGDRPGLRYPWREEHPTSDSLYVCPRFTSRNRSSRQW
ncbi:hypothetical protein VPNG_00988 [Cytospora leucostoma]|uniref:Uncharacterized protein n=1 Tax=Cytospora leucostoma TaxID=1230097 RepID=A0A423XLH4_9PEZI|nr:hypothetical protein VPNG_00988 [Cytospora leucostoma]